MFQNSYVLTACTEEQLEQVVAAVRPVLKRVGGVCLVSDALWVLHWDRRRMPVSSFRVSLAGRRLLITGAASGIGLCLLRGALADGAECAVLVRDRAEAESLAALLPAARIHASTCAMWSGWPA